MQLDDNIVTSIMKLFSKYNQKITNWFLKSENVF